MWDQIINEAFNFVNASYSSKETAVKLFIYFAFIQKYIKIY